MGNWTNEPPIEITKMEAGMQANLSTTQSKEVNSGATSPPLGADPPMQSTYKHWFKLNTDLPNSPSNLENQINQTVKADGGSPMSLSEVEVRKEVEGTPMGKVSTITQRLEDESNLKETQAVVLKSTSPFQQIVPKRPQVEGVQISPRSLSNMGLMSPGTEMLSGPYGDQQ